MPAISVIIPTRNRSSLLEEAVRSALAQTLPPSQILIVDDASDARHQAGNARVAGLDDRVRLHRLPRHRGVSAARNLALDEARGDFVVFLDDDDLLHPRMLAACVEAFERTPAADVVTCLGRVFIDRRCSADSLRDVAASPVEDEAGPTYALNHSDDLTLERVTFSHVLHHTIFVNSCLVRQSALRGVRFPEDLTAGEDTYFWLLLYSQGCHFERARQALAYVRYHGGSSQAHVDRDEVLRFFDKLWASGMLTTRRDRFFVHRRLARLLLPVKRLAALPHLMAVVCCPDLLAQFVLSRHRWRNGHRLQQFLNETRRALAAEARQLGLEPGSETPPARPGVPSLPCSAAGIGPELT